MTKTFSRKESDFPFEGRISKYNLWTNFKVSIIDTRVISVFWSSKIKLLVKIYVSLYRHVFNCFVYIYIAWSRIFSEVGLCLAFVKLIV